MLAPDDDIPEVDAGEPDGRWHLPHISIGDDWDTLSKREAKDSRETVIKALQKWGSILDDALPLLSKSGAEAVIWSDLDDAEAGVLADMLIDWGKKRALVAQAVRGIVRSYSYLEVGLITGPRFKKMLSYYVREGFALRFSLGFGRGK